MFLISAIISWKKIYMIDRDMYCPYTKVYPYVKDLQAFRLGMALLTFFASK